MELYNSDLMQLSSNSERKIAQEKLLNGETLSLKEKMILGRDHPIKEINGYKLKPNCAYRAIRKKTFDLYKEKGMIIGDGIDDEFQEYADGTYNNKGVDWYLGGVSLKYGDIILECPADKNYFIPANDNGNAMSVDPTVKHLKSSGFQNPIPMSMITNVIDTRTKKDFFEFEDIMSEQGYTYFGHGVGNGEDVDKIVRQIFNEGLRTKNNSLCLTTIGLDTPTPELKMMYQEIGLEEPSMNSLKQKLDNWEHKDSKKIILIRVPTEYINRNGNGTDMNGEMYGAFMSEKQQMDGKSINYLDSNFIIGCYDSSTGDVELNKSFERTLSSETLSKIQTRFQNAINKVKARSSTFNEIEHSLFNEQEQHVNLRKYKNSLVDNLDISKKAIDDIIAEFNYENQNEISTGGVSI